MSGTLSVAWDRPNTTGDDDHWLAVTIQGGASVEGPLSLAIAVDCSTSMLGDRLVQAREAVNLVVRQLADRDTVAVWVFGSDTRRIVEERGGTDLSSHFAAIRAGGKTRLDLVLESISTWLGTRKGRRQILLLTDGDPTDAEGRRAETGPLIESARNLGRSGVRVVTVGIGSAASYDAGFLRQVADVTGGLALASLSPAEVAQKVLAAMQATTAESADETFSVEGSGLDLLEAWRVEPRVQPLLRDGARFHASVADGARLILRVHYQAPIGSTRGLIQVGDLRTASGLSATLALNLVTVSSPDRLALNADVDRLRARVEMARTAEMRALAADPAEKLRLTMRLSDLAVAAQDPRATSRIHQDLGRLTGGGGLSADDEVRTIETLRGGTDA